MECHHEVKDPSPCCNFSQSESSYSASNKPHHNIAERSNYSMVVNTSTSDNSPSADNPSESEESFEFINDELDDANYVIEDHQKVSAVSLNDTQESNYSLTATKYSANTNFPSKDCLVVDESFELINRTPDDSVHVMETHGPSSTSNMKSQCAEVEKIAQPFSVSDFSINSQSSDSDDSFELICICAKENQLSCNHQGNVSPCSAFNMKSDNNTVFKKECSSPTGVCNNDESKKETKILDSIADEKKTPKSKNIPMDSEKIIPDRLVMERLIKGVKNCNIAEKKLSDANNKDNDPFKANVSMHDERPNPENKNLFHLAEKKDVSIPANMCKEICSDTVKRVIKGIESCSISDKEFHSTTAIDKNYSDEFKSNLNTNNHNFTLSKNNLTSTITSSEKSEPKIRKTYIDAKGKKRCGDELFELPKYNKRNCDKQQSQVYEAFSDVRKDKEENGEEDPPCRPSKRFVRRELPEGILILNSKCLGTPNKLKQTLDAKDGFKSEYAEYCSEESCRRLQESKLKEIAEKFKDKTKTTEKPMKNSTRKLKQKKEKFSWSGFDIDFLFLFG